MSVIPPQDHPHKLEESLLYLPLEHCEDLLIQDRSVELFRSLISRAPLELQPTFGEFLAYAYRHREVIRQFGRFPHRNAVLGRFSTKEELTYLRSGGETFGATRPEKGDAQHTAEVAGRTDQRD
jgi:uncharacterized protein (DUF924 family)